METVIRNVGDLDALDLSVLERVVGHQLRTSQQLVINVVGIVVPATPGPTSTGTQLPEWCRVYEGLSDEQVDDLDRSIVRSPSTRSIS